MEYTKLGGEIMDRQDKANETLITGYGEEGWSVDSKKNAIMIVTSGPTNSQMFKCVADRIDHGICFKHTKDGKWTVSLYNTRNDIKFNCGEYLRNKYGGGGHVGAAGCTLSDKQFFKAILEKSL
jgi:oligoribonuclease NrnB/cAMP/cGMP phosphodiesterase (DHH superfamily)